MLIGREAELERIDALLEGARHGRGAALLLRGTPGVGKTALLEAARDRAEGMTLAAAVGVESEAELPFAALGELATPILAGLADLPEPQAVALSAALALGPPAARVVNERLAMLTGFTGLIGLAARERPVLILVDDAHWLDRPSAECLAYAARRLDGLGVALLAAARDEEPDLLGGGVPEELRLGGLARPDALALLSEADLAPPVAETLFDLSLGNPLALRELSAALSEGQRRGDAPIEATAPGALGDALERRATAAGPEARALLLVAAAAFDRELEPVIAATRRLGIPDRALERCELAGLLETGVDGFRFAHPLLRAVVYGAAGGTERRRAHRALAEHTSLDSRAWHLAAAATGPDDQVAVELDRAAARAQARGAHAAAAEALERAARLSASEQGSTGRLFAAGLAAAMGGAFERAAALLERAALTEDPGMRATTTHLLAMVTLNGGIRPALDNHAMLTAEAQRIAPFDPAMAALMHADAGVTVTVAGLCDMVLESAERAMAALPAQAPASIRCQAHSINGLGLALKGRTAEATESLALAAGLVGEVEPVSAAAQSVSFAFMGRLCTGEESALREQTRKLAAAARESRSLGILPWFQLQAADADYRLGHWEEAEREAEDAVANGEVSAQLGPLSIALIVRARIHAARGREQAAREDARRGVEIAAPVGYGSVGLWSKASLGFLALGLGRIDEAIAELEQARALADLSGLEDPLIVPWAPDLIEAYARDGRGADAEALTAELSAQAERGGNPLALAMAARCRGLVAVAEFEPEFERALERHAKANVPFERGRTLLAFGSRLHRARRRVEARARLREGHAIFDRLGAPPWSRLADDELRAAGAIARKRFDDPDRLTAQELRVARAVARGATNREVAGELFLSPKTIEFHLGRVYGKLGIHSRTELAMLVAEGRLDERESEPRRADTGAR